MRRAAALLILAGAAMAASAAEVTIIRPTAHVGQEWPYYVLVNNQVVADVLSGERVTLQVAPGVSALTIQCPKGFGGYVESRAELKSSEPAYLVLNPHLDCVTIDKVDPKAASRLVGQTKSRPAGRPIEYDKPRQVSAMEPAGVPPPSAPTGASGDAATSVAAATTAWVDAFNSRDPARISALYDSDAALADTTEPRQRVGAAAIADYYKSVAQRPTQRAALGEHSVRFYGDTAIDSGTMNFFEMRSGQATLTPARYTLVYRKRGNNWLIVDHQVAPAPR
jgi:uncharacterized protein (TIGR02246 family)